MVLIVMILNLWANIHEFQTLLPNWIFKISYVSFQTYPASGFKFYLSFKEKRFYILKMFYMQSGVIDKKTFLKIF